MEALNSYVELFTPTQHVLLLGFYGIWIAAFLHNWMVFTGFVLMVVVTFFIMDHLKGTKHLYDSTFLIVVVDTIIGLIDWVKQKPAVPISNKLDVVHGSSPENELKAMVQYIVRDFVQSWFCDISDNKLFVSDVHELLDKASLHSLERVSNINKFVVIQDFAKLFHLHLADVQRAQQVLRQQSKYRRKKDRSREFTKMKTLEEAFDSLGINHQAIESRDTELIYLRCITDSVLKIIFPPEVYSVYAAKEMLVDILTCQVMINLVDLISQPYWLHVVLILLLSDEEPVKIGDHHRVSHSLASDATQTSSTKLDEPIPQYPADVDTTTERLPPIGSSNPNDSPISIKVQQDSATAQSVDFGPSTSVPLKRYVEIFDILSYFTMTLCILQLECII